MPDLSCLLSFSSANLLFLSSTLFRVITALCATLSSIEWTLKPLSFMTFKPDSFYWILKRVASNFPCSVPNLPFLTFGCLHPIVYTLADCRFYPCPPLHLSLQILIHAAIISTVGFRRCLPYIYPSANIKAPPLLLPEYLRFSIPLSWGHVSATVTSYP